MKEDNFHFQDVLLSEDKVQKPEKLFQFEALKEENDPNHFRWLDDK